ncbi:non-ribosomal peptide synthetase [Micromonospora sp. NPDC051227]|uniref:non-ribosomal peptide synthetase n=1 Tax=Micromonospora sp. NPDC051227 TaxID=3364285 RepID=UPI00378C98A3
MVGRQPDRPAVSDDVRTLTYGELDKRSDAVASHLRQRGVELEDRVGVYLERGVDLFVGILGVVKAGASYVAIDARYPDARRDLMIQDSRAKTIITEPTWAGRLAGLPTELVTLGDLARAAPEREATTTRIAPSTAACVLFTSGSTRGPKAIVLEHRNLVSFACNSAIPALMPEDRVGQISSISFDAFHFEIWTALAHGAQVVILPPVRELLAADFRRQMKRYGITAMLVPTMVVNHVVREDRDAFAELRILQVGGDVILPSTCREVLNGEFRGGLYNLYGPAEATTACTVHPVSLADTLEGSVPIGRPLVGVTVHVLSPELVPVPVGEVGEMFLAGPGVARGYQDQPELTAERFLTLTLPGAGAPTRVYRTGDLARCRPDGVLEFVGRVDSQVKIRGYRVEPGEVERALRRHPGVHDAVVLPDGDSQDRRLVAFVVLDGELTMAQLRRDIESQLPDFMVPSQIVTVRKIPASHHGKRDLGALRELLAVERERRNRHAPARTDTERYLVALWEDLLGVEDISRTDDFFQMGGHSMLAFRMQRRIQQDLRTKVPFPVLLSNIRLASLASVVDGLRENRP